MLHQIAALAERLTPRLVSAAVVFLLAYFTEPSSVGIYSFGLLLYTAFLSVSDSAVRQVLPMAVRSGDNFLASYRKVSSVAGAIVIALGVGMIYVFTSRDSGTIALLLAPMSLVPLVTAVGIKSVGRLQAAGRWRSLATGQLVSAVIASAISIPIMYLTHSLIAGSIHLLVSEGVNAAWCIRVAGKFQEGPELDEPGLAKAFRQMALYSGAAWGQGQADRVVLGVLAGSSLLGSFSVASALARSIGDPLASSTANVLRARLSHLRVDEVGEVRKISEQILRRGLTLAVIAAVAAICATEWIATPILSQAWDVSLSIVPILAIAGLPSSLNWSGSVLQVVSQNASRALWAPAVGLVFAPLIALAALTSLELAAYLVVTREVAVLTTAFLLVRRIAPWRPYALCLGLTIVLALSQLLLFPSN